MARAAKLKVYRTVAGFHDAYVAAPSQKAALAAWGSDKDLFARGIAEVVTDAALIAEPMASPGTIIRRSRGTDAEQLAAVPEAPRRRTRTSTTADLADSSEPQPPEPKPKPKPKPKPVPRPGRHELDDAEDALSAIETEQREATKRLDREEAELARRRRDLEARQATELTEATTARDSLCASYDRAIAAWKRDRAVSDRGRD